MPAPIPFDAPVTTATFPFSFPLFILVLSSCCDHCFPLKLNEALKFECADMSATQRRRHVAALQSAQPSANS
jgi:hypothetical protein